MMCWMVRPICERTHAKPLAEFFAKLDGASKLTESHFGIIFKAVKDGSFIHDDIMISLSRTADSFADSRFKQQVTYAKGVLDVIRPLACLYDFKAAGKTAQAYRINADIADDVSKLRLALRSHEMNIQTGLDANVFEPSSKPSTVAVLDNLTSIDAASLTDDARSTLKGLAVAWSKDLTSLSQLLESVTPQWEHVKGDLFDAKHIDVIKALVMNPKAGQVAKGSQLLGSFLKDHRAISKDGTGLLIDAHVLKDADTQRKASQDAANYALGLYSTMYSIPKLASPAARKIEAQALKVTLKHKVNDVLMDRINKLGDGQAFDPIEFTKTDKKDIL